MAERLQGNVPEALREDDFTEVDFSLWKQELEQPDEAEELEQKVLDNPEEPQVSWVESDGTVSEDQYRQQCYWVIGQFGHMLDVMKDEIATEAQAEEWLEMKMSIAAAKSETDAYRLATIRSDMIPIWAAYVNRMNINWEAFEKVSNK